jgi:hypothetical protein
MDSVSGTRWGSVKICAMIIQTNPEAFSNHLPVHTVTNIDRAAGIVTLSGSDGTSLEVRLDSWGPLEETQPVIGSRVQLLEERASVNTVETDIELLQEAIAKGDCSQWARAAYDRLHKALNSPGRFDRDTAAKLCVAFVKMCPQLFKEPSGS